MKKILVTGGAGYIGSVVVKKLVDAGYSVTVVDDLSRGRKENVDSRAVFHKVNILNFTSFEKNLKNKAFDVLMHFAARKDVGDAMERPDLYDENIKGMMNLLEIAPRLKIKQFIFSSSAAVYGEPKVKKINEAHECNPANFYGFTKLMGEDLLKWHADLSGMRYVALRYFNVAGYEGLNYIGPNVRNIFNVIADVLFGNKKQLEIFGNDYDTVDGTGVRDYVHVSDIADAHIKAMNLKGSGVFNLGSEKGYSVLEIMNMFEKVSGKKVKYRFIKKRLGDLTSVVASFDKAKKILNWQPKFGLLEMVESTLKAYNKKR